MAEQRTQELELESRKREEMAQRLADMEAQQAAAGGDAAAIARTAELERGKREQMERDVQQQEERERELQQQMQQQTDVSPASSTAASSSAAPAAPSSSAGLFAIRRGS